MADSLLDQEPSVSPALDPGFRPTVLGRRALTRAVERAGGGEPLTFALERDGGAVARFSTRVLPVSHPRAVDNFRYAERLLKFLLWQKGGHTVHVSGPRSVAEHLARTFAPGGARAFDADFMARVYARSRFAVIQASSIEALPAAAETPRSLGGHWEGCRIGFDAGGSDRKVAAVVDGEEVFSAEVVWHPKEHTDPAYHVAGILDSLRTAASHLPRVDAIGVSSAGIYVDNRTRIASLFRKVPPPQFESTIETIYLDVAKELGGVPLRVANDGDVTALAGAMSLGVRPVLGIALGTSEAVGYVDRAGLITGWLNELAFAPVDESPEAPLDGDWSGDRGIGSQYFSQEAVLRLAPRAGLELEAHAPPAVRLEQVQRRLAAGDARARAIYESVGVYLGYGLADYADFYELEHVLLLGRVTSGEGGRILVDWARRVLRREAPGLADQIVLHLPDEASRRVGQAVAAASLPPTQGKDGTGQ